jgi:hypothetical protein
MSKEGDEKLAIFKVERQAGEDGSDEERVLV